MVAALYWTIFLSLSSSNVDVLPKLSRARNVNTTSTVWSPKDVWYPADGLARLLERHLRQSPEYHLLCMHHLDIRRPYQGCSVKSGSFVYFMLNPALVRVSGKEVTIFEDSQSCSITETMVRRETVEIRWTDGLLQFQTVFHGNAAISLQLMFDEFRGKGHCKNERQN